MRRFPKKSMKKTILSFFLLFVAISIFAQSPFLSKKFTQSKNVSVYKVQSTPNNGIFIQGFNETLIPNEYGYFLSQLDSNANVLWAKKIETKDFKVNFNAATILKDGNILACYNEKSLSPNLKRIIVKTNSTMSNVIWSLENTVTGIDIQGIKD